MALTATPRRLLQTSFTTSATSVFTNTAQKQVIKEIIIANTTNTDQTFSLAIVPSGEALSNSHYLFYDAPIGKLVTIFHTQISPVLEVNDEIYINASATTLNLYISAGEFTTIT